MKRTQLLFIFALLVALPAEVHADLDDPGTIILGGGAGYSTLTGDSRYGAEFGSGGSYFFTGKFMVSRRMALGIYFQNQTYAAEAILPSLPTAETVVEVVMATYEAHAIFYFNRVADASRYLDVGIGIYRPELRSNDKGTGFPATAFTFSATLGAEVFVRPQVSLDLAIRGVGYLGKGYTESEELWNIVDEEERALRDNTGSFSGALQGQVGLLFYLFD